MNNKHHNNDEGDPLLYYLGTDSNKIIVVNGRRGKVVQTIHPVAPNPLNLPEGVYNGVATEWISHHPKFPLLYALTSYWNAQPACLVTFQIDPPTGLLTPLGNPISTGGFHAAHATFSPEGSLFAVAHHNDGKLVFFDCSLSKPIQGDPLLVIETPVIIPHTRRITNSKDANPGLPSLHHVQYAPDGKFLLTVDPSQDYIFTYAINELGLPTSRTPSSKFKCYSEVPIFGWFQRVITQHVLQCKRRARKAILHPNGKCVYILYESINQLQVYSIEEDGTIDNHNCWKEVSTLEHTFSWIGLTLQLAAELYITQDGSTLLVSNRGDTKVSGLSRGESSLRVFTVHDNGRKIHAAGILPGVEYPIRHFVAMDQDAKVVAGCGRSLQIWNGIPGESELLECVDVEANIFCIASTNSFHRNLS